MAFPKLAVAALAFLGSASATQSPLFESSKSQAPITDTSRDLVNSTELQALIDPENLIERAKELYRIAERAVDEYGHPTRVIGSQGMNMIL